MAATRRIMALAVVSAFSSAAAAAQATKAPASTTTKAPAAAQAGTGKTAPRFTVDMMWPKPLPSNKLLGSVTGLAIDRHDHIFVVHNVNSFTTRTETGADQNPPIASCCFSEQPVIEFDAAGNRVKSWGGPGPGYEWPSIPSGIAVAPNGNVWIAGTGGMDGQVLVFSHDGAFIRQIGKAGTAPAPAAPAAADTQYQGVSPGARGGAAAPPPAAAGGRGGAAGGRGGRGGRGAAPTLPPNSASMEMFGGATRISFSADGNTAYIADGARNRRVVEVDANTGAIRKFWGANGAAPSDAAGAAGQFSNVACAEASKDGMLYVCDQRNSRIQVFKASDGSFVKEVKVAPNTRAEGSVWDIAFSADAAQRFLYVADGTNQRVRILDRAKLEELTAFGEGGRVPGMFLAVGSVAVDSKGNVYTGEALEGKRIQKFIYGGIGPVTKTNQGVLWPARAAK